MTMTRRRFLIDSTTTTLGLLAASQVACGSDAGTDDEPDPMAEEHARWAEVAAELESEQGDPFTMAFQGPWTGKEGSHVPVVEVTDMIRVSNEHPMAVAQADEDDHFITAIYLKDQEGTVIYLAEFDGTEEQAVRSFPVPDGVTELTAYSHCNLHGLWKSDPVSV